MIRVLLADDQELVRTGLRALLGSSADITVVAEAVDGAEAVRAAAEHGPEVVLMDIRMPAMDGIETTRRILAAAGEDGPRVLVLTTFDDDADVLDAVRAGAAGYLLKDTRAADLREAVRTVAAGGNLLSPVIARTVMEQLAGAAESAGTRGSGARAPGAARQDDVPDLTALTAREIEVLARLAEGETNAEIAQQLFLSPATARTYVSRILTKLGARDRTALALIARRAGLGQS